MTYTREATVESYLVNRVKALGGRASKLVDAGARGFPDRTCMFPYGKIFFVETKPPAGYDLSSPQERTHRKLRQHGFRVYVAYTEGDVDALLRIEGFE